MEGSESARPALAGRARRFSRRLLALVANRLALLEVELLEAREETLGALVLVLGAVACAFLSVSALTVAIVVAFWKTSPVGALLGVTAFYGAASFWVFRLFAARQRRMKILPETMAELRKDRDCLEKLFL